MNAYQAYSASTATWLAVQAIPLLIAPNFVVGLFDNSSSPATALEGYLWRALAVGELALGVLALLISGAVLGTTSSQSEQDSTSTGALAERIPAKTAILILTELFHLNGFVTAYAKFSNNGPKLNLLLVIGSGLMSLYGGWFLLFGDDGGKERKSNMMFPTAEKRARKAEKREAKFEKLEGRIGKRSGKKSD